jgi:REP element-mobilizing transposase RayT
MSRKTAFLQSVGEYFHVYNRGTNRERIFFCDENYRYFMQRIATAINPTTLTLHAFCLMPNHFHLLLCQMATYAISDFVKAVCDGYAKAINFSLRRTGHLFEGSYKIKHVDDPGALLPLSHYIHANPVSAGLANSPLDWHRSSCSVYCGLMELPFVTTGVILSLAGGSNQYRSFVQKGRVQVNEMIAKYLIHPVEL